MSNVCMASESSVSWVIYCVFGSFGGTSLSSLIMVKFVVTVKTMPKAASPAKQRKVLSSPKNAKRRSGQLMMMLDARVVS